MTNQHRLCLTFGFASLVASIPICLLFHDLNAENVFGRYLWFAMPALAIPASYIAAYLMSRAANGIVVFGFWRGAGAAYLALIACVIVANPLLLPLTLLICGWFVLAFGGIVGWLMRLAMGPNNSFKPNTHRGGNLPR